MVDGPATKTPDGGHEAASTDTAAGRALAEADARREAASSGHDARPAEVHGRGGLEPTRYGDWEIKGLTSDF